MEGKVFQRSPIEALISMYLNHNPDVGELLAFPSITINNEKKTVTLCEHSCGVTFFSALNNEMLGNLCLLSEHILFQAYFFIYV